MKLYSNLPRTLRLFFGFMRWLMVFQACVLLALLFVKTAGPNLQLAQVSLSGAPVSFQITTDKTMPDVLLLGNTRATLYVSRPMAESEPVSLLRRAFFIRGYLVLACGYFLFDLLRKLCGNVERGNVFSQHNIRLVRNIGLLILGTEILVLALQACNAAQINDYLRQHVISEGLEMRASWMGEYFYFDLSMMVTGSCVLLLTEIFRQGLALKQENELTV